MTFKPGKHAPVLVAAVVIVLVCVLRLLRLEFFEEIERLTYDLRVRTALHFPAPTAANMAFVSIEESSLEAVQNGTVGFHFGLLWPREVYGRLVDELSDEHAKVVAFDVLFGDLRHDHPFVQMADGSVVESDDFFALQMHRAGNVLLGLTPDVRPPPLFATNALALGDISTEKDPDGVLRRVKTFRIYRQWHPLIQKAAEQFNLDLDQAVIAPGKITAPQLGTTNQVVIPIDAQTNFSIADFVGDKLPPGIPSRARAFTNQVVWHMGVVLAAQQLGLDLGKAQMDSTHGRIVLPGRDTRILPVDSEGYIYIDWRLKPNDSRLLQAPIEDLLAQDEQRLTGQTNGLRVDFRGKLVVVGSATQGNNLTDRGATPLERNTLLVSKYWNVANSIITNQFIRRASMPVELALIVLLGVLTAFLTLQLRGVSASGAVALFMFVYIGAVFFAFIAYRWWLPLFFPIAGAVFVEHLCLVTWRAVFEETEKRRVRSVFSKVVAPDIVRELLRAEKLSLGGTRGEVTVFFADVRGFTAFTDQVQEQTVEFVREKHLDPAATEAYLDESARETLNTVNTYLALVADTVIAHGGTLDKYIGDCVMAFWGAPVFNPNHAVACVRAAIEAQRRIRELNERRNAENERRPLENSVRAAAGLGPLPSLAVLTLGCGINTGVVTAGLMGSEAHQYNYTVFGREVNLASRLETVSGSARIVISRVTYEHLLRDAPGLAALCVELPPEKVKGFREPIQIYEVPWQKAG